ncbi:MAG TPA: nucleotidyltransferase family protein [Candidatus Limiplasma sp.]|nr:nucleotidyltransferase family protein [Candidatus Limiplasma sp.]
MAIAGLVLAAGQSSRMGDFKPLMRIGERTLLEASVESLFAGGAEHVTVVLGYRASDAQAMLKASFDETRVHCAINPAYDRTDMLRSVQTGVEALPPCEAFYLLPGDMPAVSPHTLRALADGLWVTNARVAFPLYSGRRKHPPLIRANCIADILSYRGEGGLRGLWQRYGNQLLDVACGDPGCGLDADTAKDFERLVQYMRDARAAQTASDAPQR